MLKKLGNPIEDVYGAFEIYEVGGLYNLYGKTYVDNHLVRVPVLIGQPNAEICREHAVQRMDAAFRRLMKMVDEYAASKNQEQIGGEGNDH